MLRELSSSISALSERLDSQASLSAQPEALKLRLQETGEIRSELERRRVELAEAQRLCQELSAIVAEPYLKEELSKRLESISNPLKSLEERAGHWSLVLFYSFVFKMESILNYVAIYNRVEIKVLKRIKVT